jgi:two-component system, cell cycle response regulator
MPDVQKRTAPRHFRSLANRLIRSIAVAGALCTLAVATLQIALSYRENRQNFEAEVRSIARVNVPLLSVNLWDIEPDAIRRQLQLIAERPQIAYVRLEAVTGQKFESGSPAHREDPRTVILDIPYPEGKPGRLGTLQLTPNIEHLYAVLVGEVLRLLAAFALLIGLICIVTAVILRRQLQLPMQHIADFAASLTPHELTRPLTLQRRPAVHATRSTRLLTGSACCKPTFANMSANSISSSPSARPNSRRRAQNSRRPVSTNRSSLPI